MKVANRPILIIEDNPMDLDLTRRAFTRLHTPHPLEVARDGEEALAYVARWEAGMLQPVVILLDLKLPKVDGLEVLRRLKSNPSVMHIPVVVLTTSSEDRDIQAAYRLGANSYIAKPLDFDRFMFVVEQIERYWCTLNIPPH